ncbi:LAZ1 homolog 1-like protein isoform X2 [Tanacetum coccineum]
MMNTKCNHSKGDMNVEAKSSSSGSCGKFIEVVIMLILIGSYYCFIHGYYCSTTVNTARTKLMLLHRILMVDSNTFGQEMVNIFVLGEAYNKVFNHLDMLHAPLEGKGLRLFRLVVGGIVGWIVVGKNPVGFVVVEKFRYNAFVVEVANVEMQLMAVAAVVHLYVFPAAPYKRGERCVRNVAVMTDYASLGTEPAADEVRDCGLGCLVATRNNYGYGSNTEVERELK